MNIKGFLSSLSEIAKPLSVRFDRSSIESAESLARFVHTRSSYIAQTALFGYLKARMGTQFRVLFEDETFSGAIHSSSVRVFLSCLSDLTVYCTASVVRTAGLDADAARGLAKHCFQTACSQALAEVDADRIPDDPLGDFMRRIDGLDWQSVPDGTAAFRNSELDLVRHAPVVDTYKELDQEIVMNSIRFRWHDVREQARKRLDCAAIGADWKAQYPLPEKAAP